jgi:hypothetical protein
VSVNVRTTWALALALVACRGGGASDALADAMPPPPLPAEAARDAGDERPAAAIEPPPAGLAELAARLEKGFDGWLADPAAYETTVRRECRRYPEGDLFPYTLPAMAYAQGVYADPSRRAQALARMAPLLDRAVSAAALRTRAPDRDLVRLEAYGSHGVYLGQLGLALASWRLAGGDDRYAAIEAHLAGLLADALAERGGAPIDSFPAYSWTFDTVPALAAVAAHDRLAATSRAAPLVAAHARWVREHGTEPSTGLPWSRVARDGRGLTGPRGCELSWRIALLAQLDRDQAAALYRRYVEVHWLDRGSLAGFAEWPRGQSERADADSGPISLGIGATATAFGLAAARALGDRARLERLVAQVDEVRSLAVLGSAMGGGSSGFQPEYLTGFLYGDAVLFYAATWHEWPAAAPLERREP